MNLNFTDNVKINHRVKCLRQRLFTSQAFVYTQTHTADRLHYPGRDKMINVWKWLTFTQLHFTTKCDGKKKNLKNRT